jgi:hypothetical protein
MPVSQTEPVRTKRVSGMSAQRGPRQQKFSVSPLDTLSNRDAFHGVCFSPRRFRQAGMEFYWMSGCKFQIILSEYRVLLIAK